jgi:twitching motility two-component system response regulator PilG
MSQVVDALKDIVKQKLSGRLTIRDPQDSAVAWEVFFGNGKLHFATSSIGQQERLTYLLRQYHPDLNVGQISVGQSDYQFICHQWQTGKLSLKQVRQLAFSSIQEAFINIMAIANAEMEFTLNFQLEPMILSVSVQQAINPVKNSIWRWQSIRGAINSPFSRLYLSNLDSLYQLLWQKLQSTKALSAYENALTQNSCLYTIAARLNVNAIDLSQTLLPLIHNKGLQISPYGLERDEQRPLIACIDDSQTIQEAVRLALISQGYDTIGITEPTRAVTKLARVQPTLILMDITMPDINGYKLCQLLRKSSQLRHIPIIMLTSRDTMFDRVRAKMVGADEYLTKPFTSHQLIDTVNKHISSALVAMNS